jgi:hypothetical protein
MQQKSATPRSQNGTAKDTGGMIRKRGSNDAATNENE